MSDQGERDETQQDGPAEQQVLGADGHPVPTSDEKLWVAFAHLGPVVMVLTVGILGWVPPLVIWLAKREESEFIADQAKESLNFQITVLIALAVSGILVCLVVGLPLLFAVLIANVVLCIMATLRSNEGERYRYPFALRLIP